MKPTLKKACSLIAAIISFGSLVGGANGAVIILVEEVGEDVVFNWGGVGQSIDLTGATLTTTSTFSGSDSIEPNDPFLSRGRTGVSLDYYAKSSTMTFGDRQSYVCEFGLWKTIRLR